MKITVGTTPVSLAVDATSTPVIQNLGPGVLYLDNNAALTAATGLQLAVGDSFEFPGDLTYAGSVGIYMLASVAGTDVRVLVVG